MLPEYKFVTATTSEIQKWLNQWKHEFDLNIISVNPHTGSNQVSVLLTRTKKS